MNPTSIIFIIVTVILACAGVLMCISANDMARKEGISLFDQHGDSENNFTQTFDIDEASLKKIVVNLGDVDVNVYGGAEKSHIDLINFTDGSYNLTSSKTQLTLSDIDGISGLINLDTFKINFNGFRNYLNYWKYRGRERTVNLYLDSSTSVIFIDLQTKTGNITLSDVDADCDYKLAAAKGDITLKNISTGSTVTVDSDKETAVKLDGVTARELILSAADGKVSISGSTFSHKIEATVKNGSFTYDRTEPDFSGFNVELRASGAIKVYGKETTGKFSEINIETPLVPVTPGEDTSETTEASDDESAETTETPKPDDMNTITVTVKNGTITIDNGAKG